MAKSTSTQVIKISSVTDGIEKVNQKIEELKFITESSYLTTGLIEGYTKDLKTETDVKTIILMYGNVKAREADYYAAAADLKQDNVPLFKIGNGTTEDWRKDCMLRLAIISQQKTLETLQQIKKEYTELMDKNDRMALLNEKINSL